MLYISLVASAVLLVTVNVLVAGSKRPVVGTLVTCAAALIGPVFFLLSFLPALALQAVLLAAALLVLLWERRGKRAYLPLSVAATLIAYGVVSYSAVQQQNEHARLQEQYPLESLESRLPPRPPTGAVKLADFDHFNQLERDIDTEAGGNRNFALKRLHEQSVDSFVNAPGFGVGRMSAMEPDKQTLTDGLRENAPVPQPDYLKPFVPPRGPLTEKPPDWNPTRMGRMHDGGVIDFVNARNFGFVKDRQHVAGFQRHGMTKVPAAEASAWTVARVDLVGLVIHEAPVAYVSANLPRMDELREAPTRPLDAFETEALESLKAGEDLFTRGTEDAARLVGAIRATKQCVACHGGSRGDLLGAFSYGLRREGK